MADDELRVLSDRYEIHRRLARGGMAQVYLARDRALDRPVAVKELVAEFATDPSFVERFRREAQAAANLSHPNVVGVYDWGAQDGTYFIVMEYIDGPSLSKVLRSEGPLHPRRAAEVAAEVAAGLGFAHSRGVVHRDVKPGNVLLTRSGEAKVTDFGIARALSSPDEDLTQAGSVMGTATYFSPEQAQGLPVDPRSDLYSLGVVLYELVTGRPPFAGETPLAIAYKHVQDEAPFPSTVMSGLPRPLEAIIMKLLAKSPDGRYANAEEVRADLNRFLADAPTVAEGELLAAGAAGAALGAAAASAGDATTVQPATSSELGAPPPDTEDEEDEDGSSKTWIFVASLVALLALLGGLLFWFVSSQDDSDLVVVPAVVGMQIEDALRELDEVGLEGNTTRQPSELEVGTVIEQTPERDAEAEAGSVVELLVSSGPEEATVPAVVGLPQAEAEQVLRDAGFTVKSTPRETDEAAPGTVVEQSPAADELAPPGSEVEIFVAVEVGTVLVPDVIGDPLAQAQAAIQEAGLRFDEASEAPSSSIPVGAVISTDPGAGTTVQRDRSIGIVVSTGPEQAEVPNVVGQTEQSAIDALRERGFAPQVQPETVAAGDPNVGRVIRQDPAGGQSVDAGSPVAVVVGVAAPTTTTSSTTTTASSSTTTTTAAP